MRRSAQSPTPASAAASSSLAAGPQQVSRKILAIICLTLAVATLAVYSRTFTYGFVSYDDDKYVYENPVLTTGLSAANVAWALRTFYYANWHPLTWISYLMDVQLFGLHAGPMHAMNVVWHLAAVLLLFLALVRMTGRPWRCALVAGLLALHPLHVESVAWISERKDVLCAFFVALTLFLYAGYAKAPSARRYFFVALAFALSLMAKPMAVTVPLALLLLDFWPLGRIQWPSGGPALRRVIAEKVPLLAMSAVAGALTFMAQRNYGAVVVLGQLPLGARAANALVATVSYMLKALWPVNLAAFYPPHPHAPATVLGAATLLALITAAAVKSARSRPYFLVGWLWFLGMLVPVIGLVQVGGQAMADRYTYLPFVGLSIAAIWTVADALKRRPGLHRGAAVCSALALAALAAAAARQAEYWQDSRTLFEHAIAVTDGNYIMENNLGVTLIKKDQPSPEAAALYRRALAANPDYADARANLGRELVKSARFDEARSQLLEAVRLNPRMAEPHADLGVIAAARGNYQEARLELEESLRLNSADAETHSNLCFVFLHLGRPADAVAQCTEALNLNPDQENARVNLAKAYAAESRRADAERELNEALRRNPNNAYARATLAELKAAPAR